MADRLLALVGPGKGPKLCTKRMGKLRIKLSEFRGLVNVSNEIGQLQFEGGCEFTIPPTPWIEVEYLGKDKQFMATVHTAT